MGRSEKTTYSFKIGKYDYELKSMLKRIEQRKLNKSEIMKKAFKFYFKHALSTKRDYIYERMILENEKKGIAKEIDGHAKRLRLINKRLDDIDEK